MSVVLLINPNTSARSLAMMMEIASPLLPSGVALRGVSASCGPPMIVDETALDAAAAEVVRLGREAAPDVSAVIVAAFGDPGIDALRREVAVPVVGIGESSIVEAAAGDRRFGIATTPPGLIRAIEGMVDRLSLRRLFTGVRVPDGDPLTFAADPFGQERALAQAVMDCFDVDGAAAVVIGGGPLSATARALRQRFGPGVIEPVPAAIRCVARLLEAGR
jgi:Asp/Glu/hydantoin racemase